MPCTLDAKFLLYDGVLDEVCAFLLCLFFTPFVGLKFLLVLSVGLDAP